MHLKLSLRLFRTLAFIIPAIILWGCVGEGDGPQRIAGTPAPALTGVLIDAPVSGASYLATSGLSGITNAAGEFQYQRSDLVTFSIGGIVLGTVQGAAYITVVELTNSIDPTARAATNMLVFLQSIDSDGDPTNGITISASTLTAAAGRTLDFSAADFDAQVAAVVAAIAPGNSVISASDALFNFYQAYAELGGTDTFDFGFPGFPPVGGGVTYELVFADEFDGDALKAANWNIETGYGPNNSGWGNNEWQLYTDSADNLRVEDGNLVISAQCPTPPCGVRDGTVTSGRINSLDKFEFRYGKVVARIKPPVGVGTWPAFWALGANFPEVDWPRSGEIDFMEMWATSNSRTTNSTIHWCDENFAPPLPAVCFPEANGRRQFTQSRTFMESLGDDFHIWEADWTPDRITVSIDGIQYFDATIDPATQEEFLRDFFLLFNLAMGGDLGSGGQPPNGTEVFPQTMLVDYVRVYQQVGDGPADEVLVDFEDDPASYDFGANAGFGGGASGVIPNPDISGINITAQVAQMQKNGAGGEVFGGSTLNLGSDLNFAQGEVFKMKVWATRPVEVLFKLEDTTSEPPIPENGLERFVDHTGSSMWEELCFDFTGATANFTSNKITFIFDLGVVGDAENNPNDWTFYYDEIEQTDSCDGGGGGGDGATATDFESGVAMFSDFEGGAGSVIDNPDVSGINTSAKVGQMQKFAGAVFGGTTLTLDAAETLAAGASYTMKVRASRAVPVLFKLEGGAVGEVEVNHSGSGTWEELCFDFTGVAGNVSGITLIFDISTAGAAGTDPDNWTFQFDDIQQIDSCPTGGGGGGGGTATVTDFESGVAMFSDFEGGAGSVIDNPDVSGINTSAKVGQMQKFAGAVFGGTTLTLDAAETLAAGASYTMKVRASRAVPVLFKLEGGAVGEVEVNHSGSGTWEELCFDFTGVAGNVSGITLIFDISTAGAAGTDPDNWTFQFDDIQQIDSCPTGGGGGGGGTATVTDFESGVAMFSDFEGGAGSVIDNPDVSGINTSAKVGQMQKFAGAVFGGTTLTLDAAETLAAGASYTMKVRASRAVPVLFKLEGGAVGEVEVNHSGSGTWEELCFDFTGVAGNVSGITLIFDISTAGAAGTDPDNWTFQFDDIQQIDSCPTGGGGGGGGTATVTDFESGVAMFSDFEGGAGSVIDNPDVSGINTSAKVGQMQKFAGAVFGGTTLTLDAAETLAAGASYTMKVRASRAVPVLFKLEGGAVGEVEVNHSGSGTWEELCFDFTGVAGNVSGITLIFDISTAGAAGTDPDNWTFQFDDIQQIESCPTGGGGGSGLATVDFEASGVGADFTWSVFENGDNPALEIVANPATDGVNGSATVAKFTARVAGQPFAGVETAHGDFGPLTLDASNSTVKIMVYKTVVSDVGIKFAIANGGAQPEIKVANTQINQWEELTFDFSSYIGLVEAINIDQLIVFPDFQARSTENIVYFDNISFSAAGGGGGGGGGGVAVTDFESGIATFSDFEGGVGSVIDNPDVSGINTSAKVGQMQKFAGATFAGTTLTLDAAETLAAGTSYTMKVRASRAVPVLFKLEGGAVGEVTVNHSGSGTWEELCFDFTGIAGNVSGITLIFDNGVAGDAANNAADWTFQFDDIQQIESCPTGGGGGAITDAVVDFEPGGLGADLTWAVFENGPNPALEFVVNPDNSGINNSATVAKFTARVDGAPFAGTNTQDLPTFTLDASNAIVKIMVYKTVISDVGLKFEQGQASTGEIKVANTLINQWEELTFDFSGKIGEPSSTDITGFVVFPDFDARAQDNVVFFDNISFSAAGGGGGGVAVTDFESGTATFSDFEGGVGSVIDNPDVSGINTSAKVGQMQKFAGATFAGTTLTLDAAETLAAGTSYTMKVRASRAVPVLFKLEGGAVGEVTVNHSGSGTWEELCFDFTGIAGNVSGITLIFDNGVAGDAANNAADWTFQFDDIQQIESCPTGGGGTATVTDFESGTATFSDFEGGVGSVIDNPDVSGINTSAKVGQMQKFAGATFAGTTLTLDAAETLAADTSYTMKVRATRAVPVLFKLEGGAVGEVTVNHSGSGTWEELCFDFTGIAGNVSGITLIFDNGVAGDAANNAADWTFQFDDIQQIESCPTGGGVAVTDFESGTATFSDFEGGVGSVIDNPDVSGINTSAKVGQMQKFAGATFAGTTLTLDAAETLAAGTSYAMKVRATRAVPVLFKLEGGAVAEVTVNHSGSGTWEELCFDFTGIAGNVSGITLIFDNGVAGDAANNAADWTFQFDDIQQIESCPTGGGVAVTDFESGTATFSDFEGGVGSVIDNPDVSGINTSAKVGQMQKFAGATFAGTTLTLDAAETLAAGTSYTMKVRASRAVPVLFKLEGGAVGEVTVNHSGSGTWEELCFDFTGIAGNVSGITLIFDNGVAGDAANNAADWTFQFDDIQQIESCPTGGGGGAITDAVVDFEPGGLGADLTWAVFENGPNPALEFVVNPDNSGINNSATVAKFTARVDGAPFAGTNTQDLPTFTLDASNAIVKIMVYKTVISDVGLKFEQGQASTGEIKVANTLINQWEELTFDFSGKIGEPSSTDITGFVVFPDFDARAQDNVVFFDNISFSAAGGGGGGVAVTDFESGTATFSDFEGGVGSVIDNPDVSGINTSAKVGQMQKFAGATFAGTTLTLDAAETLAAGTSYTMKVRATRAVPVLFKLEGGAVGEVTVNHSGSGTWEELCFDFTGIAGNVSGITLIFDNGVAGDAANNAADWTFQFDDIQQIESCPTGGGGGAITDAVVDFEPGGLGAGLTWAVFENADNPALEFVANPAAGGVNGSATVAKFTARQAGASFAGTNTQDLPTFTLDASNSTVKIMVYKTVISDVGLKFEQGQASTGEIKVANTLINQWEELTFDFSGKIGEPSSSDITGFVVFPDFDTRAQDNVIYFDNISFSASN